MFVRILWPKQIHQIDPRPKWKAPKPDRRGHPWHRQPQPDPDFQGRSVV
jgi:hypothetical protein